MMPYKENKKWRAVVKVNGNRYTSCFNTKKQALSWENWKRSQIAKKTVNLKEFSIPPNNLDELKEKVHALYVNPANTICDIFDFVAKTLDLNFRYKDVLEIASRYQKEKNQRTPPAIRANILERDKYKCQICGATGKETTLHVDHIVPKSKGGATEMRNLQTLCRKCNLGKNCRNIFSGKSKNKKSTHCGTQLGLKDKNKKGVIVA